MTFEKIYDNHKAIMDNAVLWAKNLPCDALFQEDILVIGEWLKMDFPKAFHNFCRSDNPQEFSAYSAHKTIRKGLERAQRALIKFDKERCNYV